MRTAMQHTCIQKKCYPNTFARRSKKIAESIIMLFALMFVITGCQESSKGISLGTLERDRIAHTATANEIIVELPIEQGSMVKQGDVLVRFDLRHQSALVQEAQARVAVAKAELDKLRNGARPEEVAAANAKLEGAKAEEQEAQIIFNRAQKLIVTSAISQAKFDQALAVKNTKSAAVRNAEEELLKLTNGTRPEDLQIGEANLEVAQAVLANETQSLNELTVVATRSGMLDKLPWNEGERVSIGSPVAIVLAGEAPHARIYIPQPYRVNLALGDTLNVNIAGTEQTVAGTLTWISSEPAFTPYYALNQEERARLMYLAEVQLPPEYRDLANGIPVEVALP